MPQLDMIITDAGRDAAVTASNNGLSVTVSQVGLGTGHYTPAATRTALQTEIKRLSLAGGSVTSNDTIHVTAADATADEYTVSEIGIFTSTGVLLAVYSHATNNVFSKNAATILQLAFDAVLKSLPAGSVTVTPTISISPPSATESVSGIAELATQTETNTGTDTTRIVTPAKLKAYVDTRLIAATESASGMVELATSAEVIAGTDTVRGVTPAGLATLTASTARKGLAQLATSSDVISGSSSTLCVSPSALAALTASTSRAGLVELVTSTEAQGLTDADRALTPWALKKVFELSAISSSGYQKFPSGLILQWGQASTGSNGVVTINFPTPFPSTVVNLQGSPVTTGGMKTVRFHSVTTSQFVLVGEDASGVGEGSENAYWLALGF